MKEVWISPKTIIGSVATGDYYYPRTEIIDEIWEELEKGNYILIAAPRRVGKTSIMQDIEENPRANYITKFENIQAVKSEEELYKTIYYLILSCLSKGKKTGKLLLEYLKSKRVSEIDFFKGRIKIEDKSINYLEEINSIFRDLDDNSETIVLLLDELPEVLHRLNKAGKKEEAIAILKQLRTWRQSGFKKLQFVFAGSIGIHYVVKSIVGRTSDINDLKQIICNSLSNVEALDYIAWATQIATVQYDDNLKRHLANKIKYYYTPYFINLMLEEIDKNARKQTSNVITENEIDNAFNIVVRNNDHFADWKKRLADYMPKQDFNFVNEILIHIAHNDSISIQTIYNIAGIHNKTADYMEFINDLVQDGYIVEKEINGNKTYLYISPFLKAFWKNNNPIYNG